MKLLKRLKPLKPNTKKFLRIFLISIVVMALVMGVAFGGAVLGFWGGAEIDIDALTLNQNTTIVYLDPDTGEERVLQRVNAAVNREWVDIEKIPEDLQQAFISIEDERFMEHNGYDLLRTAKATFTYIGNKLIGKNGASLGGSTITQQLIKNITGDNDRTPMRKIREISRASALEKQLEKEEILELYLNCIYLSRGCNGVQTAAKMYFDKDVSELSLAECASIAGITQNPAAYDPINNPDNNKRRQELVLGKMLELGYITQEEYDEAVEEELAIVEPAEAQESNTNTNSYFVDQVIYEVLEDLQEQGYSESLANKIVYSSGAKIYSTYNPYVQEAVEDYYENEDNFASDGIQSAITVVDVRNGQVVGIAGGIGEKTASLTLNRASQSPRQPGSAIKPIAAYAPAVENNEITPGSIFADEKKSYGDWTPRNYDHSYRGNVDVVSAVRSSLNTIPVEIINRMGARVSYDFLVENLGITTLVESRNIDGKIYSDIGLSQLALGGLTDGITTYEMAAAYAPFANGGIYYKPHTYTEVRDKDGNVILSPDRSGRIAMKKSTAYTMTGMLREVVSSGTGGGATVSGARYTAGKTGTTSDNKDRWFVGYTPYYSAAIWYGYDTPREIYASGNPCIPIFRRIMNSAHDALSDNSRYIDRDGLISVSCCTHSAMRATSDCPHTTMSYFESDDVPSYCNSGHKGYLTLEPEEEEEEGEDENEGESESEEENAEAPATQPEGTQPERPAQSGGEPIGGALEE